MKEFRQSGIVRPYGRLLLTLRLNVICPVSINLSSSARVLTREPYNCGTTAKIRCFEIDLPRTQQIKRKLLHECGVDTSGVTFVSANLLTDDWLDNLAKAGFDPRKPTFFLWEGVTYYLSREAMEKTFRTIATIAPGSVVVFDYGTDANIKAYRKPLWSL